MKKVILTGGGTGGHCLPIQVMFKSLIQKNIDCYIVTDKRGQSFFYSVNPNKVIVIWQPIESNKIISQLINLPFILLQSIIIFLKLKPNFTIGFGGYITFPFLFSGLFLRYNVAAHEANAVLGRSNRFLVRGIKFLFTAFSNTKGVHNKFTKKTIHVGMPVRSQSGSKFGKKNLKKNFKISVIGGSQGTKSFSEIIPKAIIKFQNENSICCLVNHQARMEDINFVKNIYSSSNIKCNVQHFFYDMTERIFESDLIISRSGSSTVSEILLYGKSSILIPYPYAVDNHQYYNAKVLEERSMGKIILNQNLNPQRLYLEILKVFKNKDKQNYNANLVTKSGGLSACEKMYDLIKSDL